MARPVPFLDIDGVLNSEAFFARQRGRGLSVISSRPEMIDPAAVAHLNAIVSATDCRVVLSSSWRLHTRYLDEVTEWLRERGYTGRLWGATPRQPDRRGEQIEAWLATQERRPVYAILDDEPDPDTHPGRWVAVPYATGLTAEHATAAIRLLGGDR